GADSTVDKFLSNVSEEELFNFLSDLESNDMNAFIDYFLKGRRITNPTNDMLALNTKMENVLKRIASTSMINRIRVKNKYSID
ncbi:MAG: hypothetical protein AAFW89_10765, partial [Bacteroidota bacterium]